VPHSSQFHRDEWEPQSCSPKSCIPSTTLCPNHRSFIAMSGSPSPAARSLASPQRRLPQISLLRCGRGENRAKSRAVILERTGPRTYQSASQNRGVILRERGPERTRGPKERKLLGVGSGVVSEESAFVLRRILPRLGGRGPDRCASGHDFSRAAKPPNNIRALAPARSSNPNHRIAP
jgi:hypothetical protein